MSFSTIERKDKLQRSPITTPGNEPVAKMSIEERMERKYEYLEGRLDAMKTTMEEKFTQHEGGFTQVMAMLTTLSGQISSLQHVKDESTDPTMPFERPSMNMEAVSAVRDEHTTPQPRAVKFGATSQDVRIQDASSDEDDEVNQYMSRTQQPISDTPLLDPTRMYMADHLEASHQPRAYRSQPRSSASDYSPRKSLTKAEIAQQVQQFTLDPEQRKSGLPGSAEGNNRHPNRGEDEAIEKLFTGVTRLLQTQVFTTAALPSHAHITLKELTAKAVFDFRNKVMIYQYSYSVKLRPFQLIDDTLVAQLCGEQKVRLEMFLRERNKNCDMSQADIDAECTVDLKRFLQTSMEDIFLWLQERVKPASTNIFVADLRSLLTFDYTLRNTYEKFHINNFEKIHLALLAYVNKFNEVLKFLSANNEKHKPSLHTRHIGLLDIFVSFIRPRSYARALHQETLSSLPNDHKISDLNVYTSQFMKHATRYYHTMMRARTVVHGQMSFANAADPFANGGGDERYIETFPSTSTARRNSTSSTRRASTTPERRRASYVSNTRDQQDVDTDQTRSMFLQAAEHGDENEDEPFYASEADVFSNDEDENVFAPPMSILDEMLVEEDADPESQSLQALQQERQQSKNYHDNSKQVQFSSNREQSPHRSQSTDVRPNKTAYTAYQDSRPLQHPTTRDSSRTLDFRSPKFANNPTFCQNLVRFGKCQFQNVCKYEHDPHKIKN